MDRLKFYIAEALFENREQRIILKEEVSQQEMETFFHAFDFLGDISPADTAYEIAIRNGREFLSFMDQKNLVRLYLENKVTDKILATDANRLLFNLCASVKTFVDYSNKALSKRKKDKENFEKYISCVFDSKVDVSYRFFDKLRNFCIHYSFPFSKVVATAPDSIEILCEKSHLQKYDGWGAVVGKDLNKMPDNIDVYSLVEPLLGAITSINLMLYFFFTNDYSMARSEIANLQIKYDLKSPIFVSIDENHNMSLHPIPSSPISRGIEKLKAHPSYGERSPLG